MITVAEFQKCPEDDGPLYHELRHGEVVAVSRPKLKHIQLQKRIERLLESAAKQAGVVVTKLSFRPTPEYELRVADVAYISSDRWAKADPEGDFPGAPELVIEVLSPSNTVAEMDEKEQLCLENGAQQFWVVDSDRRQIKSIHTPRPHHPLPIWPGHSITAVGEHSHIRRRDPWLSPITTGQPTRSKPRRRLPPEVTIDRTQNIIYRYAPLIMNCRLVDPGFARYQCRARIKDADWGHKPKCPSSKRKPFLVRNSIISICRRMIGS